MATDLSKRVFISYSRKDMEFVDRLEVGLTARGFVPWLDRSHIEGGDDWQDSIERAIDTCDKFVVILTPDALESEWVKIEYRYGHSMKKRLIPVLLKPCPRVPAILNYRQWVTSFPADFDLGLNDLLVALSREDPQTEKFVDANPTGVDETGDAAPGEEPTMSVLDLDIAGSEAYKKGDLELAAIYWQRLLDIEPDYLSGDVAAKVATIEIQLAPIRAQRLRDKAYEAHRRGEWESEIANWEEFLKIQDDEEARGELANARRNAEKPQRDRYARAKAWTERSENDEARKDLAQLWSQAPFYGDPDGIAPKLGLAPPVTYREKKRLDDEKAAQDAARRAEEKRRADELAAQEAARRAEEARRQSEIAAAEAARRAEEKRLADVAAASAAGIRAEKMRAADARAADEARKAGITRAKAAEKKKEAKRKADLRQWKRENRAPYREDVSGYDFSGFAIWLSALLVMVGAVFFALPALRATPVASLVRTNIPQANLVPADLLLAILATLVAAALVYAIGYWRALNIGVYLLAAVLAAPLAWLAVQAWQGASQKLTPYSAPFFGRQAAGDWWQFPLHHGLAWAAIFGILAGVVVGFAGALEGGVGGFSAGLLGGIFGGALLGVAWSFLITSPITLLGWGYGGLATGAVVGALTYLITMAWDEDDFPPDAVLVIALLIALLVALLQWAMWAWGFGIGFPAVLTWALSLLIGLLVSGALILTLRIMFTRRDPIPQELRKVASK